MNIFGKFKIEDLELIDSPDLPGPAEWNNSPLLEDRSLYLSSYT